MDIRSLIYMILPYLLLFPAPIQITGQYLYQGISLLLFYNDHIMLLAYAYVSCRKSETQIVQTSIIKLCRLI